MYYRNVLSKIKNNSVLIKKNKVYKLNEKYQRYWIEDCLDEIKDKDFIEFMKKNKMIKESGPSSKICKKDLITTLHLQITDACMCRCGHCYVSGRENTFLAFGDFKCIVDDFVDAGMVSLDYTGGEPTLHPEFMEFINEMYITYNPFVNVLFNFSTKIYSKLSLLKGKLKKRGEKNDSWVH